MLPVIWPECDLATNPTVEGEATNTCLSEQFKRAGVKVTGSPCVWFGTTKVYSGVGADIVMESITLKIPQLDTSLCPIGGVLPACPQGGVQITHRCPIRTSHSPRDICSHIAPTSHISGVNRASEATEALWFT